MDNVPPHCSKLCRDHHLTNNTKGLSKKAVYHDHKWNCHSICLDLHYYCNIKLKRCKQNDSVDS